MSPKEAKRLVGRTIVAVEPGSHWEGSGSERRLMHAPRVHLDDGSHLYFVAEEHPEGAEYGVDMFRTRPAKRKRA